MPYDTKPIPGGFLRLKQIIGPYGPIPISRSSWWAGVSAGRFPKPVKLAPRTSAWRVDDIAALISELSGTSANPSADRQAESSCNHEDKNCPRRSSATSKP